eukprot:scaffold17768_cov31-Tisochrysis_lutea.AAC.13
MRAKQVGKWQRSERERGRWRLWCCTDAFPATTTFPFPSKEPSRPLFHPPFWQMQSTPSRLRSPACVSSDSRSLIETYAPLTGGSFKETLANAKKYAMLSESSLDEFSNRSAGREHKRSRTKLTVIGPPVAVTKINSYGQPEEPRFVHGSLKMLRVRMRARCTDASLKASPECRPRRAAHMGQ